MEGEGKSKEGGLNNGIVNYFRNGRHPLYTISFMVFDPVGAKVVKGKSYDMRRKKNISLSFVGNTYYLFLKRAYPFP